MGGPLRLDKALVRGVLKEIKVTMSGSFVITPIPDGWILIVLYGKIDHITGTDTLIRFERKQKDGGPAPVGEILWTTLIDTAKDSHHIPLFSTIASEEHAQYSPIILTDEHQIYFSGGAASGVTIIFLGWRP